MEQIGNLNCDRPLESGELYLFHVSDPSCPPNESLWGVLDFVDGERLVLESYTLDQRCFVLWRTLPEAYRYCRRATREELRDYTYNIALYESAVNAEVR